MEPQPILNKLIFLVFISDHRLHKINPYVFLFVLRYMDANKIQYPSERLYFKYQLEIFCAVVLFCWMEEQRKAITLSKTYDQVIVGGDAR